MKTPIVAITAVATFALLYTFWPRESPEVSAPPAANDALAAVIVPDALSPEGQIGQRAYEATCMACHGANGAGRDGSGPPLIHKIYEPSHHGDASFQRAAELGVRSHHWPFGDMPPQTGVTGADVQAIVAHVREIQRANGIN